MIDLSITYEPTDALATNPRNARTHSRAQIRQIAESIETFGFTNPLLVDEAGVLIAGHGRLAAAHRVRLNSVPVIRLLHLDEAQKRALALADNRIALGAGWDVELLTAELTELSEMELDFDLEVTGFETTELDMMIGGADGTDPTETAPEPDPALPAITRSGDLWHLGDHRLLCGDARNQDDLARLMGDDRAHAGFTDPPYNVPIDGHATGGGRTRHRDFAEAVGEMSAEAFTGFLTEALGLAAASSRPGAVWFACMDWRHLGEMLDAGKTAFGSLLNLCVWTKTNGGMGLLYRSQHELVFVFREGNPVYIGRIRHKGTTNPGQHQAIIDQGLWRSVQARLAANRQTAAYRSDARSPSPLAGRLTDPDGNRMRPSHARKANGTRYRYYVSATLIENSVAAGASGWRISAAELEAAVARVVAERLRAPALAGRLIAGRDASAGQAAALINRLARRGAGLRLILQGAAAPPPKPDPQLIRTLLQARCRVAD